MGGQQGVGPPDWAAGRTLKTRGVGPSRGKREGDCTGRLPLNRRNPG